MVSPVKNAMNVSPATVTKPPSSTLTVPLIDGPIPRRGPTYPTQVAGEGVPSLRTGRRGDQLIQLDIRTPTHLSKKQESLLKEFAQLESNKLSKKLKNILKGAAAEATR